MPAFQLINLIFLVHPNVLNLKGLFSKVRPAVKADIGSMSHPDVCSGVGDVLKKSWLK